MRVCLFEDQHVELLEPLTLTRPAFDLLCGQTTLAAKQVRHLATGSPGVLVRPCLEEVQRQERQNCPVNDMDWLRADMTVMVNGRWLPPQGRFDSGEPRVGMIGNQVAYAVVPREMLTSCSPGTIDDCVEVWKQAFLHVEAGGKLVRHLWELVDWNGQQIVEDFAERKRRPCAVAGPGVAIVGPREQLFIDPTAKVEPMVVVDTTGGPVVIDAEAVVTAFTRLEGPCYVGPRSQVLGAKIRAGTSLGPQCRVGGEVEASILLGYSNKYHEGFLGHSYVGEWVNLGAGTHNSDLRNDYGSIVVTVAGQRVETGRSKVGCFLGDHTKSGLGTLLNTGTSAGVFCNLLPCGGLLPKYVPSFCSVWNGTLAEKDEVETLLATARKAMTRRGCELSEERANLYRALQSRTTLERQRALREGEQRRLRRSA
jgi:UDP-N-acetylglucosamine diphosphorylase / glucose-1-phosphate thymidylyltransferase / UDP-N-acetylgalactosamine diphosphorylase / glucosamine-1-phosphate N-acetyltransferase / galactosamine-1-phosphate N-acetyltransferase